MNLQGDFLRHLQRVRKDMEQTGEDLKNRYVEAQAGGKKVEVVFNGRQEPVKLSIDPELLKPGADGKADVAVYRRATNMWHVLKSSGGGMAVELGWTWTHSTPVPGDYDGDGKADLAFYAEYNAVWVIQYSSTGTTSIIEWGVPGGTVEPVPADYDGDGRTDLAYYYAAQGSWRIVPSLRSVKTSSR